MTFRNDRDARETRRESLTRELSEIDATLLTASALRQRRQLLAAELAELEEHDAVQRRLRLPLLASLEIASPCEERWEDMLGDDRERWCGRCHELVYDLTRYADVEAEALLGRPRTPCVRFARRADGTVTTASCKPANPLHDRGSIAAAVVVGVITSSLAVGGVGLTTLPAMGRGRVNQTRSDAQAVRSAVLLYLGQEPGADCPSMERLVESGTIDHSRRTTDAWDQPYRIECDGDDILVRSDGPDGRPGTEDDIQ